MQFKNCSNILSSKITHSKMPQCKTILSSKIVLKIESFQRNLQLKNNFMKQTRQMGLKGNKRLIRFPLEFKSQNLVKQK